MNGNPRLADGRWVCLMRRRRAPVRARRRRLPRRTRPQVRVHDRARLGRQQVLHRSRVREGLREGKPLRGAVEGLRGDRARRAVQRAEEPRRGPHGVGSPAVARGRADGRLRPVALRGARLRHGDARRLAARQLVVRPDGRRRRGERLAQRVGLRGALHRVHARVRAHDRGVRDLRAAGHRVLDHVDAPGRPIRHRRGELRHGVRRRPHGVPLRAVARGVGHGGRARAHRGARVRADTPPQGEEVLLHRLLQPVVPPDNHRAAVRVGRAHGRRQEQLQRLHS